MHSMLILYFCNINLLIFFCCLSLSITISNRISKCWRIYYIFASLAFLYINDNNNPVANHVSIDYVNKLIDKVICDIHRY